MKSNFHPRKYNTTFFISLCSVCKKKTKNVIFKKIKVTTIVVDK